MKLLALVTLLTVTGVSRTDATSPMGHRIMEPLAYCATGKLAPYLGDYYPCKYLKLEFNV